MTGCEAGLDYLYGLEKSGIILGLDNISWLLGLLGRPERSFSSIHVGGTNGKGSVVCMLSAMLRDAGYRTGMYTSPHLIRFNERIQVDGREIEDADLCALTARIRSLADGQSPRKPFSFFDFTTAMAFLYFRERQVDWGVVEVGLGGRFDSTNVLRPSVSVITNVAMDHEEYLGSTIPLIASEKAGIVKEEVPLVTGATGDALKVIREKAAGRSRVYVLGEDFSYEKTGEGRMTYRGLTWRLEDVSVGLAGDHQLSNASLALCAAELLPSDKACLLPDRVQLSLERVRWPGRIEIVARDPLVLMDAAHNPHGAGSLASFLQSMYPHRRKILVFGAMKDKNWKIMLDLLSPLADMIILTRPVTDRAESPENLSLAAPGAMVTHDVGSALLAARKAARKEDLIVVTGSLYIIGEAKTAIDEPA